MGVEWGLHLSAIRRSGQVGLTFEVEASSGVTTIKCRTVNPKVVPSLFKCTVRVSWGNWVTRSWWWFCWWWW